MYKIYRRQINNVSNNVVDIPLEKQLWPSSKGLFDRKDVECFRNEIYVYNNSNVKEKHNGSNTNQRRVIEAIEKVRKASLECNKCYNINTKKKTKISKEYNMPLQMRYEPTNTKNDNYTEYSDDDDSVSSFLVIVDNDNLTPMLSSLILWVDAEDFDSEDNDSEHDSEDSNNKDRISAQLKNKEPSTLYPLSNNANIDNDDNDNKGIRKGSILYSIGKQRYSSFSYPYDEVEKEQESNNLRSTMPTVINRTEDMSLPSLQKQHHCWKFRTVDDNDINEEKNDKENQNKLLTTDVDNLLIYPGGYLYEI